MVSVDMSEVRKCAADLLAYCTARKLECEPSMSNEPPSALRLEIGHVLFIDIVGYSRLLINEQTEVLRTLNELVRATPRVRAAEAENKLIRLPSGDGMALVFRDSPESPAGNGFCRV